MMLEPDLEAARTLFLLLGQIHLVAITPDGPVEARDFARDVNGALAWARQENAAGRNIYFTVNEVQPGCHRKPEKAHILAARFCHVDIDPPHDGAPWDKCQALAKLREFPCSPSFIVDSGNGWQAFWRLAERVVDRPLVEALNAQIARRFGGDACHNIDRLMRVPGFVNIPGAAKRRRGRVPASTGWGQTDSGVIYSLAELEAAFAPGSRDDDAALLEWRRRNERPSDEELIARCQRGDNWHNNMRDLTARLVGRGLSDADILALAPRIALSDFTEAETRADMRVAIRGAREKWAIPEPENTDGIRLEFAMASDIATATLEYLVDPYLPKGCVVGFNGRGGAAKSSFLATIAASISPFASTLWISVEEPGDWIKVRHVKSDGAEMTLAVVTAVPSKKDREGRVIASSFDIYEHLELAIIQAAAQFQRAGKPPLRLVTLDTAVALTGWTKGETPNDDASVKRLLGFLQALTEKYEITIAFIHHANKQKHDHFADAVAGSSAWTNSPRLSFILATDRREEYSFVLRTAKSNLTQPFAVPYSTKPVHILHRRDDGADSVLCSVELGAIKWGADASLELFDEATRKPLDDDSWRQASLVDDAAQTVARLVQNSDQPITREIAEREFGRPISRREWTKIDRRLGQHKVAVARGDHNRSVYGKPTTGRCDNTPVSEMW